MKYDYTKLNISRCLDKVGIKKGDILYCHSNIGFFGKIKSSNIAKLFYNILKRKVGKRGTLIFPSYSYSFSKSCKKKIFNLKKNNFNMGMLSAYAFNQPEISRTNDPMFSVLVCGKLKNEFLTISNNSFDEQSVFGKFFKYNGKIINFNFSGCTFLHFIERKLNVNYRYDKTFRGNFVGQSKKIQWISYVRKLSNPKFEDDPFLFTKYIKKKKIAKFSKLGKGEVTSISANQIYNVVKSNLKKNYWFLTAKGINH